MSKITVAFLGKDCPGVVAAISRTFGEAGCNIEAVSQTMLCGEFSAIFVVDAPQNLEIEYIQKLLENALQKERMDISLMARPATGSRWGENEAFEPFVVTVDGPDGPGLIGSISRIFANHGANIENLNALLGETSPEEALFIFEIMIPENADIGRLRRELECEAAKLDLRASIQHRDIFEAMNRVKSF